MFKNKENAQMLQNCIYNFRKEGKYLLLSYVIMPTHFHALLVPDNKFNISQIMHSIKRGSSRLLSISGIKSGPIWLPSFYEHVIRNKLDFREKYNYIQNNPVEAGLAKWPADYEFSSANPTNENDLDKYWVG